MEHKGIPTKEVAVILPYQGDKVLMQLRDFNPHILFPACWGFFGGSIKADERPKEAASRELFEEICYKTAAMHKLSVDLELDYLLIHSFCCPLTTRVERLILNEGLDLALLSLQDIAFGEYYSKKMKKSFPVVKRPYIAYVVKKLKDYLNACQN